MPHRRFGSRASRGALAPSFALVLLGLASAPAHADLLCDLFDPSLGPTGQVVDEVIPVNDPPALIQLVAKGGDGGDAQIEYGTISSVTYCNASGGKGAEAVGSFPVGFGPNQLQPGGTLRFVVGAKGNPKSIFTPVSIATVRADNGFGTGIFYRPPGVGGDACGTDWVPLLAADGGEGGYHGLAPIAGCVDRRDGAAGSLGGSAAAACFGQALAPLPRGGGSYVHPWATLSSISVSTNPVRDGEATFRCDCAAQAPANDSCGSATRLREGVNLGCTDAATNSADAWACLPNDPIQKDVWYEYVNEESCAVEVEVDWCQNDFRSAASFQWGCDEAEVACGGPGTCRARATLAAGENVVMRLGGLNAPNTTSSGEHQINVSVRKTGQDTDLDGVPDGCDVCPIDAFDDSDQDGVCDSADPCPDSTFDACTPVDGFVCGYEVANWTTTPIAGGISFPVQESDQAAGFTYLVAGAGQAISDRAAIFETTVENSGAWGFDYVFTGNHGVTGAEARFSVAVVNNGQQTTYGVVDQVTNGAFSFTGTVSVPVRAGDIVGLLVGGEHNDPQSAFNGTVRLRNVSWPDADDVDLDGVPDTCDVCADGDDTVDLDADGVPDACDTCPLDRPDDPDGDGVCFSDDICRGFDDSVDTDADGVPDGCDICEGSDDTQDGDGDGVPDGCDLCADADDAFDRDGDGVPDGCDAPSLPIGNCSLDSIARQGDRPLDFEVPAANGRQVNITLYGGGGGTASLTETGCDAAGGAGAKLRLAFTVGSSIQAGSTLRFILGAEGGSGESSGAYTSAGGGGGSAVLYLPPGGTWGIDDVPIAVAAGGGGGVARVGGGGGCYALLGGDAEDQDCGFGYDGNPTGGCEGTLGGAEGVIDPQDPSLITASGGGGAAFSGGDGGVHGGAPGRDGGGSGGSGVAASGGWGYGGGGGAHFGGGGGGGGYMGGSGRLTGGLGGVNYVDRRYLALFEASVADFAGPGYATVTAPTFNDNPFGQRFDGSITENADYIEPFVQVVGDTCSAGDTNQDFISRPPQFQYEYSRFYDIPEGPYRDVWYAIRPQGNGSSTWTVTIWTDDPADGGPDDIAVSIFSPLSEGGVSAGRRGSGSLSFDIGSNQAQLIRVTTRRPQAFNLIVDQRAAGNASAECADAPLVDTTRRQYRGGRGWDDGTAACDVPLDVRPSWLRYVAECTGTLRVRTRGGGNPSLSVLDGCGGARLACDNGFQDPPSSNVAEVTVPMQAGEEVRVRIGEASPLLRVALPAAITFTLEGPDTDGDGTLDSCDTCPNLATDDQTDTDGDGVGDACDPCVGAAANLDADGDGVCDADDRCEGSPDDVDADGDGQPDGCDPCPNAWPDDADRDGNCGSPLVARALPEAEWTDGALGDGARGNACPTFNDPATFEFWTFQATAGERIVVAVERQVADFDPYASLWAGDLTGTTLEDFVDAATNGAQNRVAVADNEVPPATVRGAGGDPLMSLIAPQSGTYTLAVAGACASRGGAYPYGVRLETGAGGLITNVSQGTTHPTIQDALDNANNQDVIEVGPGTVFEDGIVIPVGLSVTLRGAGRNRTIIDGSGPGALSTLSADGAGALVIEGMSFINGRASFQPCRTGGVEILNTPTTLRDVGFHNNEAGCFTVGQSHLGLFDSGTGVPVDYVLDRVYAGLTTSGFAGVIVQSELGSVRAINSVFEPSQPIEGQQEPFINVLLIDPDGAEFVNSTISGLAQVFSPGARYTNSVFDVVPFDAGTSTFRRTLAPGVPAANPDSTPTDSFDGAPQFVDGASGDYRLTSGSLGVDAADYAAYVAASGGATDAAGRGRTADDPGTANTGLGAVDYLDVGAFESFPDADGDTVADAQDLCAGYDDRADADGDGLPDACDPCAPGAPDADGDGVCDLLDACPGSDDTVDGDSDGVPDGCDICLAGDDAADADDDQTPDACDACPNDPNQITASTWYADADTDAYGDPDVTQDACDQPQGFVAVAGDCDDAVATTNPGAGEVCDGADNDCDGVVDDNAGALFFADGDDDGAGDALSFVQACVQPAGFVDVAGDCDDTDAATYPGAPEICDSVDNDCNGAAEAGSCPDPQQICEAIPGGFECQCPDGYADDGFGGCADVDECAAPDACGAGAICINTDGSFDCSCAAGFESDGGDGCVACAAGTFSADGGACQACPVGRFSAAQAASCDACPVGTFAAATGSVSCTPCPVGRFADATGASACAPCDTDTFADAEGSATCQACADGSGTDGVTGAIECTDIDECLAGTDDCPANADCSNEAPGFSCTCSSGYVAGAGDADGTPDLAFGTRGDGEARIDVVDPASGARPAVITMTRDASGRILVAGETRDSSNVAVAFVARFRPDGTIDPAFGDAGFVRFSMSAPEAQFQRSRANTLLVLPDGRIFVAGAAIDEAGQRVAGFARLYGYGELDETFGDAGVLRRRYSPAGPPSVDEVIGLAPRGSGYLVVSEAVSVDGRGTAVIAAIDADGAPDPGYGSGGTTLVDLGAGESLRRIRAAFDNSGGVAVAGESLGVTDQTVVVRIDAVGAAVAGFGTGGYQRVQLSPDAGREPTTNAVVIRPDGSIVIAGRWPTGPAFFGAFGADGALLPAFGDAGVALFPMGNSALVNDLVALSDGGVFAVGERRDIDGNSVTSAFLARLTSTGGPAAEWNGGAVLNRAPGDGATDLFLARAHVGVDGSVVAAGISLAGARSPVSVVRYAPGLACVDEDECAVGTDTCDDISEVCINTDGGFVCGCAPGYVEDGGGACVACPAGTFAAADGVCRPCAAGTFSEAGSAGCSACQPGTFGAAEGADQCALCPLGTFAADAGATACSACPVGRFADAEGSAACAPCAAGTFAQVEGSAACQTCAPGTFAAADGSSTCDACAAGTFASAAGSAACETCPFGSDTGGLLGAVECTDIDECTVFAAVNCPANGTCQNADPGYDCACDPGYLSVTGPADGTLDPYFGGRGDGESRFSPADPASAGFNDLRVITRDAAGRILVAGEAASAASRDIGVVARLLADGSLDATFGDGGIVRLSMDAPGVEFPNTNFDAIHVLPDGRLLLAGTGVAAAGGREAAFARLLADGAPDPTFGDGGFFRRRFSPSERAFSFDHARGILPDATGFVAIVASVSGDDRGIAYAVRFNDDGTLDPTYGTDGQTPVDFGAGTSLDWELAVAFDAAGRPVLAGMVTDAAGARLAGLARLTTAGALDATFGAGGLRLEQLGEDAGFGASTEILGLAIRPDGSVAVGGSSSLDDGSFHGVVALFDTTGALVPEFGTGGVVRAVVADRSRLFGLTSAADGSLVAVGDAQVNEQGTNTGLAIRIAGDGGLDGTWADDGVLQPSPAGADTRFTAYAARADDDGVLVAGDSIVAGDPAYSVFFYPASLSCADEDECATGNNDCGVGSTCVNTDGGFTCECDDGYAAENGGCVECAAGTFSTGGSASCTLCPAGRFAAAAGSAACLPCAEGTFSEDAGSASCELCQPGTFADQVGAAACQVCPVGRFAAAAGANSCAECAIGTFADTEGSFECTECAAGTFADTTGSAACAGCAPGTFMDQPGSDACLPCAEGSFAADAGSTSCELCQPGTFADQPGADACEACPFGRFAAAAGANSCAECAVGTFADTEGSFECTECAAGTFADTTGSVACAACAPGTFMDQPGSDACLPCAEGSFAADAGSTSCELCQPGTFADQPGADACEACPFGRFAAAAGANSCAECAVGTFADTIGSFECTECAAGTFADTTGSAACAACAPGTFMDQPGSDACLPCAEGSFAADAGSTSCELCQPGTFADQPGAGSCADCPPGFIAQDGGSVACQPCAAGTFADAVGGIECLACAAGTFTGQEAAASCSDCPVGTFADTTGSAACTDCAPGTIAANAGASACDACLAGTFAGQAGSAACAECAVGTFAPGDGAANCDDCAPGTFADETGLVMCAVCPADTFASASGSGACTACPAGTTAPAGAVECTDVDECVDGLDDCGPDEACVNLDPGFRCDLLCDDGDGDGVCDDVDVCDGDDASGDSDGDGVCDDLDVCAGGNVVYEAGTTFAGSAAWTPLGLTRTYTEPVIVTTPQVAAGGDPAVVRLRESNGVWEVRIDSAGGGAAANVPVRYFAIEAGVYTADVHGMNLEAVRYTSTVTDFAKNFVGEARAYQQPYDNPVVLGQVMSAADPDWSVFWSRGRNAGTPPQSGNFFTGKHVGEDPNTARADELVGYIVAERGAGTFCGVSLFAELTADTIRGVDDDAPYTVLSPIPASRAVATQAAMDGSNGGWATFYGVDGVTENSVDLAIDEDIVRDAERAHTTEQVALLFVGETCADGDGDGRCDDADNCPADPNVDQANADGDALGDVCDVCPVDPDNDADGDGFCADVDNCPDDPNADQTDSDDDGAGDACDLCPGQPGSVRFANGVDLAGTDAAVFVPFGVAFDDAIVVATSAYAGSALVARVESVEAGGFWLRLLSAEGVPAAADGVAVHWFAIERGQYSVERNGLLAEAARYTSSRVDDNNSWAADAQLLDNSYAAPVVLGQVVSAEPTFSSFWARGSARGTPPSTDDVRTGRMVGEDPVTDRADEDIHYVVLETADVSICGRRLLAAVGPNTIRSPGNNPPFAYATPGDLVPETVALSMAGMNGTDGGWPVLGDLRVGSFDALILEDTLADDDGNHTNEQLAYLLLSAPLADAPTIDRFEAIPVDPFEGTAIRLEWETTGASSVEIQPDVGAPLPADGEASVTPVGETLYTLTATGPGGQVVTTVTVSPVARPPVPLTSFELAIDNAAWLPVALPAGTFTTPVVIATPAYGQGGAPAIARIRNVGADGFEIIAARADGGAEPLPAVTMQVLVVEAGRYTEAVHGVNLEAGTVGDLAAVGKPNIAGTPLAGLQNAYGTPVVLGHVQSTNDARFQTFFATGGSSTSPPSAGDIRIGRHTGEDPDGDRAAETVGYVVVEAGTWTVNGSTLVAGRTGDQVRGVDDTAPYSQAIEGLASVDGAALSLNGVDGGDGGWPLFSGPDPVTAAALAVSIDEDTLGDGDRTHTTEQVGWVVFGN